MFLCSRAEEHPADMGGHAEIDLICVLSFLFGNGCLADQYFCNVICCQPCPYLLHDKLRLIRMEITQTNRIFQFPERSLDAHLRQYSFLISSGGNSSSGRFVMMHSYVSSEIGKRTIRKDMVYVSREPYSM